MKTVNTLPLLAFLSFHAFADISYPIVDTSQTQCFDEKRVLSSCPSHSTFTGQDAQYQGNQPSYHVNDDGTVTDTVTGLMWTQTTDTNGDGKINATDKMTYQEAITYANALSLSGYNDWRLPNIKELYSLILFDGQDPSGIRQSGNIDLVPFLDQTVFSINSGDTQAGERLIDSQFVSSTKYVSKTMIRDDTVFGVNFIDGRIKGYGMRGRGGSGKTFYVLLVRDNPAYGSNQFVNTDESTITDNSTGLTWQRSDSQSSMKWPQALKYCENLELAGHSDWRLPDIKELHSIVDYTRSPETSFSAAIDPLFHITAITNEAGETDYANYWSSTTHRNMRNGANAAYIAFGRSMGKMNGQWIDVHGAGAQRSDPKSGNSNPYPDGHGPQGDAVRVENMVRCVTGGDITKVAKPVHVERASQTFINSASSNRTSSSSSAKSLNRKSGMFPAKMDKNGDGKISRSEAKGPLANHFGRLDSNNDGYLSADEIPAKK
ncbi:DUF1566 domain-containing protein [Vibrio sonorensis]|uniref:Lcl domain-containing protein n=1 Tax=Vibrio sonorensis TaxID=1004316 RepID=UPI0008D9F385|nr:DUF1566 domain-containing protein [Vibrio sonorensis]